MFTPFVVTTDVVRRNLTLDCGDVGRIAILINGCIYFVDNPEDGAQLDEDGSVTWRFRGEDMSHSTWLRCKGLLPL